MLSDRACRPRIWLSSRHSNCRSAPSPLISARSGSDALRGRERLQVGELLVQETIEVPDEYTYHCPPEHDGETLRMGKRRPAVTASEKIVSARTSASRSSASPSPAPSAGTRPRLLSRPASFAVVREEPARHPAQAMF
jgi:hypothetical protein